VDNKLKLERGGGSKPQFRGKRGGESVPPGRKHPTGRKEGSKTHIIEGFPSIKGGGPFLWEGFGGKEVRAMPKRIHA